MSRDKGKRGEREFAALCKEFGYDAHRTAQCKGKTGQAADVEGLPGLHVEVKRTERFSLYDSMAQAKSDCAASGGSKIPIVAHRKNDCAWVVVMEAKDFLKIYAEWEAAQEV